MSGRPRLVEEGKPIEEWNEEVFDMNHFLDSEYQKTISRENASMIDDSHQSLRNRQNQLNMLSNRQPTGEIQRPQKSSSLQSRLKTTTYSNANTTHTRATHIHSTNPPGRTLKDSKEKKKFKLVTQFQIPGPIAQNCANVYKDDCGINMQSIHVPVPLQKSLHVEETNAFSTNVVRSCEASGSMDIEDTFKNDHNLRSEYQSVNASSAVRSSPKLHGRQENNSMGMGMGMGMGTGMGIDQYQDERFTAIERMEVDELHSQRLPMVIIDGANVAYAYAQATGSMNSGTGIGKVEPNVLGIQLACSYFRNAGCRVQVVIPAYWMRKKHNYGHSSPTLEQNEIQILQHLKDQNLLFCSPPTDDDDAYCIAIARRIDARFQNRSQGSSSGTDIPISAFSSLQQSTSTFTSCASSSSDNLPVDNDLTSIGGGFILSNDLFRDAIARDPSGDLRQWLKGAQSASINANKFTSRLISYSFGEFGSMNKYGDEQLDFLPNPRHALVALVERSKRSHDSYIHE